MRSKQYCIQLVFYCMNTKEKKQYGPQKKENYTGLEWRECKEIMTEFSFWVTCSFTKPFRNQITDNASKISQKRLAIQLNTKWTFYKGSLSSKSKNTKTEQSGEFTSKATTDHSPCQRTRRVWQSCQFYPWCPPLAGRNHVDGPRMSVLSPRIPAAPKRRCLPTSLSA